MRQLKREVKIGNVTIGGKNPIAVQTMLNVPVEDIEGNVAQAKRCEAAGCQILRVTCPSAADAKCIEAVKNAVNIPIVADIHFDYKAALACADVGVDKIRINPGNIGDDDRVKAVVDACQQKNIPIHALGFVQQGTADGKQQMRQTWQHILDALCNVLCHDAKIRPGAFTEQFTPEQFAGILFSLMLSAVVQQNFDPSAVLEIVRRAIY